MHILEHLPPKEIGRGHLFVVGLRVEPHTVNCHLDITNIAASFLWPQDIDKDYMALKPYKHKDYHLYIFFYIHRIIIGSNVK